MTTFNGCPYLEQQLASAASQLRLPDEIVIGDDQSTDETARVVERFAAAHSIPTHFTRNATRLGSTVNFERTITRCRGDIVVFADQDDVWLPQKLARLEAAFASDPRVDYAFSDGFLIDPEGKRVEGTIFSSMGFEDGERQRFRSGAPFEVLLKRNVVAGAALAVKRASLERLMPFEPGWVHDYFIACCLALVGRGVVIDEPLIEYRRHASQQIGVARPNVGDAVSLARRQGAAFCRQQLRNFEGLEPRFRALGIAPAHPVFQTLREKVRFLRARAQMREAPWLAPALLWRSFRRGDYRRYSVGWRQTLLDMIAVGHAVRSPG